MRTTQPLPLGPFLLRSSTCPGLPETDRRTLGRRTCAACGLQCWSNNTPPRSEH